jgi:hypothetical protein
VSQFDFSWERFFKITSLADTDDSVRLSSLAIKLIPLPAAFSSRRVLSSSSVQRFSGAIISGSHLKLFHRDVAGPAIKVGTLAGLYDLKTFGDRLNGRRLPALGLDQGSHAGLAALRAPQFLVPVINHRGCTRHIGADLPPFFWQLKTKSPVEAVPSRIANNVFKIGNVGS